MLNYTICLTLDRQYELANEWATKTIINERQAKFFLIRGIICIHLERFKDAINDLNEAAKEFRGHDLPYFKSKAYHLSGNPHEAWA